MQCYTKSLSRVRLFATPWTVLHQAPLSMGFSRQEYWSGLPFPTPEDLPDPEIKAASLEPSALVRGFFTTEPPGKLIWNAVFMKTLFIPSLYGMVDIYIYIYIYMYQFILLCCEASFTISFSFKILMLSVCTCVHIIIYTYIHMHLYTHTHMYSHIHTLRSRISDLQGKCSFSFTSYC